MPEGTPLGLDLGRRSNLTWWLMDLNFARLETVSSVSRQVEDLGLPPTQVDMLTVYEAPTEIFSNALGRPAARGLQLQAARPRKEIDSRQIHEM